MSHLDHDHGEPTRRTWRFWIPLIGFFAIIGYFLWTEHRAHLASAVPYLPYLLLLACPFLHFFMHRGHSHGHEHRPPDAKHDQDD